MFHDMALFPTVTSSRPDGLNRSCTGWRHQARQWRSIYYSPLGASCNSTVQQFSKTTASCSSSLTNFSRVLPPIASNTIWQLLRIDHGAEYPSPLCSLLLLAYIMKKKRKTKIKHIRLLPRKTFKPSNLCTKQSNNKWMWYNLLMNFQGHNWYAIRVQQEYWIAFRFLLI